MKNTILPLMSAIPLAAAFMTAFIPRRRSELARYSALISMLTLSFLSLFLLSKDYFYEMGDWAAPLGITLRSDPFSALILVFISFSGFFITAFGGEEIKKFTSAARFYVLILLLTAGINGTLLAGDLFNRFVFVELAAIASYILVGFACSGRGLFAAFKYALLGASASAITLVGIAVIYSTYGTLDISLISLASASILPFTEVFTPLFFAAILIFAGFGLKAGLMPLHIWAPDALERAPGVAASVISSLLIPSIGIYALLRTSFSVFGVYGRVPSILSFIGIFSILGGAVRAFSMNTPKRRGVYLMISHTGFTLAGFGVFAELLNKESYSPAIIAFSGGMLLLLLIPLIMPLIFLTEDDSSSSAGFLAVAGAPPFATSIGRFCILYSAFLGELKLHGALFLAGWLLSVFALIKSSGSLNSSVRNFSPSHRYAVIIFTAASILAGALIIPGIREIILNPAGYALSGSSAFL